MFIAVHYVRINGVMFMPDEVITEPMSPKQEAWLLGKGAIRKAAETPFPAAQEKAEGFVEVDAESGADGDDEAENTDMTESEDDTEDEAEEEYEDVAPMEIDVAESITPAEETAPKAKEKPTRKRQGRKENKA